MNHMTPQSWTAQQADIAERRERAEHKTLAAQRDELAAALRALMAGVTAYNLSSMRTVDIAGQAEARAILAKVRA